MNLQDIMKINNFVLCGDTLNEEKYACKIKLELLKNGYNVFCVGKENNSINDAKMSNYVLNLCIHPVKGIALLKEIKDYGKVKVVLIQPGAESEEIINFLKENNLNYLEGCSLVGLKLYKK